jgi:hypothetical protein
LTDARFMLLYIERMLFCTQVKLHEEFHLTRAIL